MFFHLVVHGLHPSARISSRSPGSQFVVCFSSSSSKLLVPRLNDAGHQPPCMSAMLLILRITRTCSQTTRPGRARGDLLLVSTGGASGREACPEGAPARPDLLTQRRRQHPQILDRTTTIPTRGPLPHEVIPELPCAAIVVVPGRDLAVRRNCCVTADHGGDLLEELPSCPATARVAQIEGRDVQDLLPGNEAFRGLATDHARVPTARGAGCSGSDRLEQHAAQHAGAEDQAGARPGSSRAVPGNPAVQPEDQSHRG